MVTNKGWTLYLEIAKLGSATAPPPNALEHRRHGCRANSSVARRTYFHPNTKP